MITKDQVDRVEGGTLVDAQGGKIGSVGNVYFDDRTGGPQWVTVSTGLFGTSQSFVPLAEATLEGDNVRVPFGKDKVKDAPRVDADQHLDVEQERALYRYYGLEYDGGDRIGTDKAGTGRDAMTVSEEQLKVGTQKQEAGRARLRKHVVTEQQNVTVPVEREKARVEREPITDANVGDATSGETFTASEHEVVLHEEQPVVEKEAVPVERVRLAKETVTDQEQVNEEVRKERVEPEGDIRDR